MLYQLSGWTQFGYNRGICWAFSTKDVGDPQRDMHEPKYYSCRGVGARLVEFSHVGFRCDMAPGGCGTRGRQRIMTDWIGCLRTRNGMLSCILLLLCAFPGDNQHWLIGGKDTHFSMKRRQSLRNTWDGANIIYLWTRQARIKGA